MKNTKRTVLLVANGDLRQTANQTCWPAQRAMEQALTAALAKQSWDDSIKSLVQVPDVLAMMAEQLDWTQKLGDAMLAQHEAMWKSAPSSSADRYELHSKFMAQHAQQHEALSAAYKSLYSVLTPEQRAVADQRGGGYGPRGPGAGWR